MPGSLNHVQEWLQADRVEEPPHRCKKIIAELATEDGALITCLADDGTQQIHHLVAMSSLSRRACYKCGNVGHYAEVCSSAERLCYNCKVYVLGYSSKNTANLTFRQAAWYASFECIALQSV